MNIDRLISINRRWEPLQKTTEKFYP